MIVAAVTLVLFKGAGGEFSGMALGGFLLFALPLFAMFFVGVKDRFQPWQDFVERGQAAGGALLALRALRSDGALLSLKTLLAARTLHARLTLWSLFAAFALWTWLAGFTRLAARTFRAWAAGMTLRAGASYRSLRSGLSGPYDFLCHAVHSDDAVRRSRVMSF